MKKIINLLMFVSFIAILSSCTKTDEFLDKKPLGDYSEIDVWSDPTLIETFVNTMYRNALGLPFTAELLSNYVDESNLAWDWDIGSFNKSLMTSDGLYGWSTSWTAQYTRHFQWDPLYANVRRTNIFFSKINGVKADDPSTKSATGWRSSPSTSRSLLSAYPAWGWNPT